MISVNNQVAEPLIVGNHQGFSTSSRKTIRRLMVFSFLISYILYSGIIKEMLNEIFEGGGTKQKDESLLDELFYLKNS